MTFKHTFQKHIFSETFIYIFIASVTMVLCNSVFENLIKYNGFSDGLRISYKLFSFCIVMIIGAVLKTYVFYWIGQKEKIINFANYFEFLKKNFSDWMITEVRVQFRVLIGLLLFIIPGVLEALRLSLASVFVFYSPKMSDPTYDPVLSSREVLNLKNYEPLYILFTLSALNLAVSMLLANANFFDGPVGFLKASLSSFSNAVFIMATYSYLVHLYLTTTSKEET